MTARTPSPFEDSVIDLPSPSPAPLGAEPASPPPPALDGQHSLRNALKLGGSLVVTYGIALVLRMVVPRFLGPEEFGRYNWADGFSGAFFVLSALGLDVYIRKEVSVRPQHASEFLGGTLLLQVGLALGLLGAMSWVMHASGEVPEVRHLALLLGGYQFLYRLNAILAAVLHARERVDGLSVAHVVMKCIWGGGLLLVVFLYRPLHLSLAWLAVPFVAAEFVKVVFLFYLTHEHAQLTLRLDARSTGAALLAALPFFLNDAALATNGRVDVSLLGVVANKTEVGYYGAVWGIAGMTMLLSPILGWVLLPMMSRAAASSPAEFIRILHRGLEGVLVVSMPVTLALALGAETWVRLMIGSAYLPAAPVLRLLAPIFVLTYVATVCGSWLMAANRPWTVTRTSLLAAVMNPALNLLLIPPLLARLGPAGGASATALSLGICEVIVTLILLGAIGMPPFDERGLSVLGKTVGVCIVVTLIHLGLGRVGLDARDLPRGLARMGLDGAVYLGLVLATGAVRRDEVLALVRRVRERRASRASASPARPEERAV